MKSGKQSNGDYYGYPKCCIRAFHIMLLHKILFESISLERQTASKNGFVPCQRCAERIVSGEIKIQELILPTRRSPKPFIHDV
jgi:hypothetical protein